MQNAGSPQLRESGSDHLIGRGVHALREASEAGLMANPKVARASEILTGFSGMKLTGTLQRLTSLFAEDPAACYLEVGVFQGLTLHSVAVANPSVPCYGIDNFSTNDPEKKNLSIVEERKRALENDNVHLINQDYEDALESLDVGNRKIAVYFVDGPHDYRSQLMCLELALPYLHDGAFIIVDDSNYKHVRQANRDFLAIHPDFKLLFEAYSPRHPEQMTEAERIRAYKGWWNGVNVLCRDPNDILSREYPPTDRDRYQFELDHLVHAHGDAKAVAGALALYHGIRRVSPKSLAKGLVGLIQMPKTWTKDDRVFEVMNTESKHLPDERINASFQGYRE